MKRQSRIVEYSLAVLILAPFLLPILFVLCSSFLSEWEMQLLLGEVGRFTEDAFLPLRIPPYEVSLYQYETILLMRPEILVTVLNSMGYVVIVLAGMLLIAPPAAFAFAKLQFRGNNLIFFVYVFLLLLPFQVMCVPLYLTMNALELIDSPWALILPEIFSPMAVFLLRQFMKSIPDSLIEAAALDGAGLLRVYVSIILPVSKPALAVCCVFCAAKCWNMIEQPLLFIKTLSLYPLSLYISEMLSASQPEFLATCVLAVIPMLLLFCILKDDMMTGIRQMEL